MLSESEIARIVSSHKDKLDNIEVCLFDVDGILTNSQVRYDNAEMGWNRSFNTRDGYGLKVLMQAGLKVGVISGGDSEGLNKRFVENLGLNYFFTGDEDKRKAYLQILEEGYKDSNILYMGDEFFDLPLLKRCGFSATVPNASFEIKSEVDYVTQLESGQGCVREVIDILRYAQDIVPKITDFS